MLFRPEVIQIRLCPRNGFFLLIYIIPYDMSTFSVENDAARMTTVTGPSPFAKKYVTRACDICKKRKCKCDGLAVRCFCSLDTEYPKHE